MKNSITAWLLETARVDVLVALLFVAAIISLLSTAAINWLLKVVEK